MLHIISNNPVFFYRDCFTAHETIWYFKHSLNVLPELTLVYRMVDIMSQIVYTFWRLLPKHNVLISGGSDPVSSAPEKGGFAMF